MERSSRNPFSFLKSLILSSYLGKWVVVGILIGLIAGLGATAFYYLLQESSNFILGSLTGFYPPNPAGETPVPPTVNPHYYLIPVSTALGGLGAGLLIYFFAPEAEGHGTDAAIDAFHNKNGVIRKRVPIIKMLASSLTIGSGGSAGREGPTAQISAGFGSFISGVLGLSSKDRRIAVAAGIGAGIGSIFKSPFGGAILSAEILYSAGDMEVEALIPAFIASPIGYVIFASFTNFEPIFGTGITYTFNHPLNLIFYAILGAVAGVFGRFYTFLFYKTKDMFSKIKIKKFLRPMIGGAVAGTISIFFPEVTGMGYGYLQYLIDGKLSLIRTNYIVLPLVAVLLVTILAKVVATSFTIGSGGSGGVFAPSLVIGGFLGAFLWLLLTMVNKTIVPTPAPFVIIGMMALFAGVGRTPIAVILMVSEMTGTLQLMIPSMIAVVISYYIAGPKYTIYKSQVRTRADSPAHRGEYSVPVLARTKASDIMTSNPVCVEDTVSVSDVHRIFLEKQLKRLPVVQNSRLVGIITVKDLLNVKREEADITSVSKIMTKNVVYSFPDDSVLSVLRKMHVNRIGGIPIVTREDKVVIGIITESDIYRAYQRYDEFSA
ncbi:MAG: chloride channel protein [Thermoplasmatales archaeon]